MNPTDVDKIAEAVVGALSGGAPGLLGCGAVSSATDFSTDELFCGTFECGGMGEFACNVRFGCGLVNGVAVVAPTFSCDDLFHCDQGYGFSNCVLQEVFAR